MSSDFQYARGDLLLKVSDLSVSYSSPILRDVNLEIRDVRRPGMAQGQKVALLAPSGTGKSQLFKRLSGLKPPSSGTVLIGPTQVPVRAGMVGMVPQNYFLFEHRTVESSLMLAARMHGPDATKAKADVLSLMTDFGLEDKLKAYPHELSGGQQQRVSIAEQLLASDHFLLMDEPFSGLDIKAKKIVCDIIDRVSLRDELNTTIFSTHDIESAVMIADTILILGREVDTNNHFIPGARILQSIDLIDRNLAWHPDVEHRPGFTETVREIKDIFVRL